MALPTAIWPYTAPKRDVDPSPIGAAVTPSDDDDLSHQTRALYVGVGGDVVVLLAGMLTTLTLKNVADGQVLPLNVRRVFDTGTSATDIVAWW